MNVKPTFKQYHDNPELYESDESRVKQLRDAVRYGRPGAVKQLDALLKTLAAKGRIKGDIEKTAKDYETWKKSFQERRGAAQRLKDNEFANARSKIQAADSEHGSDAFKRETGSVRREPKGSMGTIGTTGTS